MDLLDDVCECASAFLDCYFHVVGIICRRWDRGNEDEVNKRVGISWKEKERRIYIFVTSSFTVLYTRFGVYFSIFSLVLFGFNTALDDAAPDTWEKIPTFFLKIDPDFLAIKACTQLHKKK